MMQIDLKNFLKEKCKNEKVYYYPNGGNAGDSLIALGTFHLFDKINLNYTVINPKKDYVLENKILICGGGGNLVNYYGSMRNVIEKYHNQVKILILLPHTINSNLDLIKSFGENSFIFTREKVSYEYVKKHNEKCTVYLAPDCAFYCDVSKVLSKQKSLYSLLLSKLSSLVNEKSDDDKLPSYKAILKTAFYQSKNSIFNILHNKRQLNSFRNDAESTNIEVPVDNVDVSEVFKYGTHNKEIAELSVLMMFNFLIKQKRVRTNRLHVAISGALLGIKTEFYPNSYYKNKAVYEFSIKGRYSNVLWKKA